MFTTNIIEAKQLIKDVAIGHRHSLIFAGGFGIGKSEMVNQVASEVDAVLCDIRLSQYDSVDLRGIPSAEDGVTVWNVPGTLPFKTNPKYNGISKLIILFLDEMGSAQPAVQAPAYQLTNDRCVGEHELMDNVVIVAATNRDSDKGVHHRMAMPLANRFTWAELVPDVEVSTLYAQEQGWPPVWAAFINFRKSMLHNYEEVAKSDPTMKTIATPRSWSKAMAYYADPNMSLRNKQIAMAGAVGSGPAADFWSFVEVWQQVATYMPRILKEPKTVDLPTEMGMTYAISVAVSGNMTTKNVSDYHAYLVRLDPEYVILAWQLAINRDTALMTTPEFIDFSKRYKAIF